jgi:hypothetical protein
MQLWHLAPTFAPLLMVDDRPTLQLTATGVILEVLGRKGAYRVELTQDEAERIAEAIDWRPPRGPSR